MSQIFILLAYVQHTPWAFKKARAASNLAGTTQKRGMSFFLDICCRLGPLIMIYCCVNRFIFPVARRNTQEQATYLPIRMPATKRKCSANINRATKKARPSGQPQVSSRLLTPSFLLTCATIPIIAMRGNTYYRWRLARGLNIKQFRVGSFKRASGSGESSWYLKS